MSRLAPSSWLMFLAFLIAMLGTTLPTPLYPLYEAHFGFPTVLITVIFAVYAVGVIAGLMLFGHLSDEIGRRTVLLPGLALSGFSAIAFLLANDLALLFVGRVLSGLSAGIFTGAATAALVELAPENQRMRASLVAVAANLGGLACGPLLAGLLAQFAPFPFKLPYAVDLVLIAPAVLCVAATPETVKLTGKPRLSLRFQHLRIPAEIPAIFIRASTAGFCAFAVAGVFSSVAPSVLATVLHQSSHALAGFLVFLFMAVAASGQIGIGRISKQVALPAACGLLLAGLGILAASLVVKSVALLFCLRRLPASVKGRALGSDLAPSTKALANNAVK